MPKSPLCLVRRCGELFASKLTMFFFGGELKNITCINMHGINMLISAQHIHCPGSLSFLAARPCNGKEVNEMSDRASRWRAPWRGHFERLSSLKPPKPQGISPLSLDWELQKNVFWIFLADSKWFFFNKTSQLSSLVFAYRRTTQFSIFSLLNDHFLCKSQQVNLAERSLPCLNELTLTCERLSCLFFATSFSFSFSSIPLLAGQRLGKKPPGT